MAREELEAFKEDIYAYLDGELPKDLMDRYQELIQEDEEALAFYAEINNFEDQLARAESFSQVEPPGDSWKKFQEKLEMEDSLELDVTLPVYGVSDQIRMLLAKPAVQATALAATALLTVGVMSNQGEDPSQALVVNKGTQQLLAKNQVVEKKPVQKEESSQVRDEDISLGVSLDERLDSSNLGRMSDQVDLKTVRVEQRSQEENSQIVPSLSKILINEVELNAMVHVSTDSELPAFYMDKFPVTNLEYSQFIKDTGHKAPFHWEGKSYKSTDEKGHKPVTYVSWNDAQAFCDWEGKALPSAKEWEAAAGAPQKAYPWGDEFEPGKANSKESGIGLVEVGQYPDNKSTYGVYDLVGNVSQWVQDDYEGEEVGFFVKKGQYKVRKGGSFLDPANKLRLDHSGYGDRDTIYGNTGIRCVSKKG